MSSISPLSYGKHNNIYFNLKIGSRKSPIIIIKLVGFFDTGKVYITGSNIKPDLFSIMDFKKIKNIIDDLLEPLDFDFHLFSNNDYITKRTSEKILKLINNG